MFIEPQVWIRANVKAWHLSTVALVYLDSFSFSSVSLILSHLVCYSPYTPWFCSFTRPILLHCSFTLHTVFHDSSVLCNCNSLVYFWLKYCNYTSFNKQTKIIFKNHFLFLIFVQKSNVKNIIRYYNRCALMFLQMTTGLLVFPVLRWLCKSRKSRLRYKNIYKNRTVGVRNITIFKVICAHYCTAWRNVLLLHSWENKHKINVAQC